MSEQGKTIKVKFATYSEFGTWDKDTTYASLDGAEIIESDKRRSRAIADGRFNGLISIDDNGFIITDVFQFKGYKSTE